MRHRQKAQSLIEYSVLLAVAVTAFSVMQVYLRRSVQAGVAVSADEMGKQSIGGAIYDEAGGVMTAGMEEEDAPEENLHSTMMVQKRDVGGNQLTIRDSNTFNYPFNYTDHSGQTYTRPARFSGAYTPQAGYYYDPKKRTLHNINIPDSDIVDPIAY